MEPDAPKGIWQTRRLEVGLVVAGAAIAGLGVFAWKTGGEQPQVEVLSVQDEQTGGAVQYKTDVTVDVSGAVAKPGVYKLPPGSRTMDAINQAGGVTNSADQNWIEKYLNRSAVVADGAKIYIPYQSDSKSAIGTTQISVGTEQVNLNSASLEALDALPGIGEVTAKKIVEGRPYMKLEELVERKIISQKVWEQIKDKVSIW
jgi:competence protein ComEA